MKSSKPFALALLVGTFVLSDVNFESIATGKVGFALTPAAEARIGRPGTARSFAGQARRVDRRVDRRVARRNGYWRNGIWIATGVAAAGTVAAASNTCAYYYNQWQSTGSSYWRNVYYDRCG